MTKVFPLFASKDSTMVLVGVFSSYTAMVTERDRYDADGYDTFFLENKIDSIDEDFIATV